MLAGRAGRQRYLRRPGGPTLEVIVDEAAVFRRAVPLETARRQLRRLAELVNSGQANVTLRVLRQDADIEGFSVPRSAFSIYAYPDPGDPTVVAVDTVTSDLILTDAPQVARYEQLYGRLRDAALSPGRQRRLPGQGRLPAPHGLTPRPLCGSRAALVLPRTPVGVFAKFFECYIL